MTFFVSSLLFLRRNLPPAAAIEHLFHWTDKHPSFPWLFAFLAIPCRLWIRLFTTPLFDGKLFCQDLSLFFCKLSSTPCCFKSPPFSSGEYSSSTELSDAVYKPTVGTFVYSPVILTEWSSPGLVQFFFFFHHSLVWIRPSSGQVKKQLTSSFSFSLSMSCPVVSWSGKLNCSDKDFCRTSFHGLVFLKPD